MASKVESYFSSAGLKDSDLRAALIAFRAARVLRDIPGEKAFAQKSVDILHELRETWSPTIFHSYISRPDIRSRGNEILALLN